ncbi:MarR family winged helix-turn-helix transcriptional regulator [Mastigocladopsis repens]|uniref:MarR family winged helix-turn-helix transcriptional regulator n=1 Tax=Mastigocladopsis repens TaxID=221287 RepID=UPI0002F282F9|nr:MarR family winged helix-turn-helix transcriptional regulator [Mastigocladopsis repens]
MLDVPPAISAEQFEHWRKANFPQLLLRATRSLNARITTEMHKRGHGQLRSSHSALLANLDIEGTCLTELAEQAGMTKQAMGELLMDLEDKGYVERRSDPIDRRAKRIYFTEIGRRGLLDAWTILQEVEAEFRAVLGTQGFQLLRTALIMTLEQTHLQKQLDSGFKEKEPGSKACP